jgi:plasmid stabilization system protein ParE
MSYRFHPLARVEHLEHVAYYESQRGGLGARYLAAFEKAMENICAAPHRYKAVGEGNRKYSLQGFPFDVFYQVTDDRVEVLAVAHHRRRPNYWIERSK